MKQLEEAVRVTSPNPDGFNVLNHGDAWINNYLFSYDENNKPTDILFVDFQLGVWASPAMDLYYFFISSTHNDLKTSSYFDYFIHFYHTELVSCLEKMQYIGTIPTLQQLHIDLLDKGKFSMSVFYSVLPFVLLDSREDASMANIFKEDSKILPIMYQNARYIRVLELIVPMMAKKGLVM